jgi:hypothetical protein
LPILLRELGTQLPILLGDSTNFRELFTLKAAFLGEPLNKNLLLLFKLFIRF